MLLLLLFLLLLFFFFFLLGWPLQKSLRVHTRWNKSIKKQKDVAEKRSCFHLYMYRLSDSIELCLKLSLHVVVVGHGDQTWMEECASWCPFLWNVRMSDLLAVVCGDKPSRHISARNLSARLDVVWLMLARPIYGITSTFPSRRQLLSVALWFTYVQYAVLLLVSSKFCAILSPCSAGKLA